MKTPEEVASDWLGAGVGARYFHHETLVPLIEADRKEAVAEFVRLLACEMCPACMHGNAWRKGLEYLEHTGMGPCRVITPCDAAGLWEFAREKGIDL